MDTDQRGEDVKRQEFLGILMGNERAGAVEEPRRRRPAARIPHSIGVWRDAEHGRERRLREFQRLPALAEGLWGHGTTTVPSAGRTWQGERPWAYFSQLIFGADRSFRGWRMLRILATAGQISRFL